MLSVYGLVRVDQASQPIQMNNGGWVINLLLRGRETDPRSGEIKRDDIYQASMFMDETDVPWWSEKLKPGTILMLDTAKLEGPQPQPDGQAKGWMKLRLSPSPRQTIVKDF